MPEQTDPQSDIPATDFTHLDAAGRPHMVDVGAKTATERVATAEGYVRMSARTLEAIERRSVAKGDVLAVAQVAAIMAAKRTWELVPLCHPLPLDAVDLQFDPQREQQRIRVEATVRTTAKTGVEMEALAAVAVGALTIYDMCKALDRGMLIDGIALLRKAGGRSGEWRRDRPRPEGERP